MRVRVEVRLQETLGGGSSNVVGKAVYEVSEGRSSVEGASSGEYEVYLRCLQRRAGPDVGEEGCRSEELGGFLQGSILGREGKIPLVRACGVIRSLGVPD